MRRDTTIEATLRSIEDRVLGEVWLGRARCVGGRVLAAALVATALMGAVGAHAHSHTVALTAHILGVAGALISLAALHLQRFAWGCVAMYVCGVATVAGIGAFWWYRTGHVNPMPLTTAMGSMLSAALTVGWLSVLMTPIHRSQPDMRAVDVDR